jgi:hypothetical protein
MTETTIEAKKPTAMQYVFVVSAFALVFAFWAWSLPTPSRAVGDSSVQSLRSNAFSPISRHTNVADITEKCRALIKINQEGHPTDAEAVQLGEQASTCVSFFTGYLDGYNARQEAIADKKLEFCIPPDVYTFETLQTFLEATAKHPEGSQLDGATALQAILVKAYPCKNRPPVTPLIGQPNHI